MTKNFLQVNFSLQCTTNKLNDFLTSLVIIVANNCLETTLVTDCKLLVQTIVACSLQASGIDIVICREVHYDHV